MKFVFTFLFLFASHSAFQTNLIPLRGSHVELDDKIAVKDVLNPQMNITITIVTNSLENTQKVYEYYSSFNYFTFNEKTDMHVKMQGMVIHISQVFNVTLLGCECKFNASLVCYASTSDAFIPYHLRTSILGILGLEKILIIDPMFLAGDSINNSNTKQAFKSSSYIGPNLEQVYGFPSSDGSGANVGIISLGGYFNQSDLQDYFDRFGLGIAPIVNMVFVDGAKLDFVDKRIKMF